MSTEAMPRMARDGGIGSAEEVAEVVGEDEGGRARGERAVVVGEEGADAGERGREGPRIGER